MLKNWLGLILISLVLYGCKEHNYARDYSNLANYFNAKEKECNIRDMMDACLFHIDGELDKKDSSFTISINAAHNSPTQDIDGAAAFFKKVNQNINDFDINVDKTEKYSLFEYNYSFVNGDTNVRSKVSGFGWLNSKGRLITFDLIRIASEDFSETQSILEQIKQDIRNNKTIRK